MTKRIVSVLGAGSWGTALAQHLDRIGHQVHLWGRDDAVIAGFKASGSNTRYLRDLKLSPSIQATSILEECLENTSLVVFAVPSAGLGELAVRVKSLVPDGTLLVSTAKGLEEGSLKTMSEVLKSCFGPGARVAVLSGPSFAREVFLGLPTAVTMAASDPSIAAEAAAFFHIDSFRVYTTDDVVGVEFGGVVKNVIALAAGVVEGMGMGSNARAALITRGLLEMQRLTLALGGQPATVTGLSGLGDLLLTATGDLSRNRTVGLRLGRGEKLEEILKSLGQVAESVTVTPKIAELARKLKVKAPIIEEADRILSGASKVEDSVRRLLSRAPGAES